MDFVVGDETGQLKLVLPGGKSVSTTSKNVHNTTQKSNIYTTAPSVVCEQKREFAITSLQWSVNASSNEDCIKFFDRFIPSSCQSVLVGRANGLVETVHLSSLLPNFEAELAPKQQLRLHMPSSICYAAPASNNTRIIVLGSNGDGAVTAHCGLNQNSVFENDDTTRITSLMERSFDTNAITNGKVRKGRTERSMGLIEDKKEILNKQSFASELRPFLNILSATDTLPSWITSEFRVQSPVGCATMSTTNTNLLAFGGLNNLLKIIDFNTMQYVFNSRNTDNDMLDLSEKIDVRAVAFMERLSPSCCVTGNYNGRMYVYDYRCHGKPVLDVQVCPNGHSIVDIAPSGSLLYEFGSLDDEECEQHMASTPKCCWKQMVPTAKKLIDTRQSVTVSDNKGNVYLYDIRRGANRDAENKGEDLASHMSIHPPPSKRTKYHPESYGKYKQSQIVHATPKNSPVSFTSNWVHNLEASSGCITKLQWSFNAAQDSRVLGVGTDRYAHIWDPAKKQVSDHTKVYLKTMLVKCLWLPSQLACSSSSETSSERGRQDDEHESDEEALSDFSEGGDCTRSSQGGDQDTDEYDSNHDSTDHTDEEEDDSSVDNDD